MKFTEAIVKACQNSSVIEFGAGTKSQISMRNVHNTLIRSAARLCENNPADILTTIDRMNVMLADNSNTAKSATHIIAIGRDRIHDMTAMQKACQEKQTRQYRQIFACTIKTTPAARGLGPDMTIEYDLKDITDAYYSTNVTAD